MSETREIQPHEDQELTALAYSPCGSLIAIGDESGAVLLSTVSLAETQAKLQLAEEEEVTAISTAASAAFGEQVLAVANAEGKLRLMRAQTAEVLREIVDNGGILTVAFSFDGGLLASGGHGGVVVREAGNEVRSVALESEGEDMLTSNFGASAAGPLIALTAAGKLRVVGARNGELLLDKSVEDLVGGERAVDHVTDIALSPSGSLVALAVATEDDEGDTKCEVLLIDLTSGAVVHRVDSGESDPLRIAFSHRGDAIAFGTDEGALRLSSTEPASEPHPRDETLNSDDWIRCVSWSSKDEKIACGDDTGVVKAREPARPLGAPIGALAATALDRLHRFGHRVACPFTCARESLWRSLRKRWPQAAPHRPRSHATRCSI